jgi:hypothetical protein
MSSGWGHTEIIQCQGSEQSARPAYSRGFGEEVAGKWAAIVCIWNFSLSFTTECSNGTLFLCCVWNKYEILTVIAADGQNVQEELERNAGRRDSGGSKGTTGTTGTKGSGTSVLNCGKCGNISLVSGGNSRCPACGAESPSNHVQGSSYSSSATQGSGPRMREVACPTCTVHLQVFFSTLCEVNCTSFTHHFLNESSSCHHFITHCPWYNTRYVWWTGPSS